MPYIQSILCPIDFSEFSAHAYEYARSLAWHYKAKLLLQHVLFSLHTSIAGAGSATDTYEQTCGQLRAEAEQELQWFARKHARTEIRPQCVVQDGPVADQILSFAEEHAVNLIVMGTHGLRGIDRLMLGSVTERVLRRAPCPVLAVRKPAQHVESFMTDPEPVHLRRIVLCCDFSDHSHRASEYAISMAKQYGAELTLLHVLEEFPRSTDLQSAMAETARQMDEIVPAREECIIKSVVRVGKPYQQIIQLAVEAEIDLLIMGVRGRGALDSAVFGSTTYRVIQLGSCPVLAVQI